MKGCICHFVADTPVHLQGDEMIIINNKKSIDVL